MKRKDFFKSLAGLFLLPFIPKPKPEVFPGLNGKPFHLGNPAYPSEMYPKYKIGDVSVYDGNQIHINCKETCKNAEVSFPYLGTPVLVIPFMRAGETHKYNYSSQNGWERIA